MKKKNEASSHGLNKGMSFFLRNEYFQNGNEEGQVGRYPVTRPESTCIPTWEPQGMSHADLNDHGSDSVRVQPVPP